VSRAAARRAFDALERRLAALAQASPRLALFGAGPLGALRNRLSRRWPGPEQVRALFPELDRRAAARVAWEIAGGEARNRLVVHWLRSAGLDPVRPLLRTPEIAGIAALRPPVVLAMFHIGAVQALGAALERLSGPVLALRRGMLHATRPPLELATTEGGDEARAAAFRRALSHLDRGGFVALTTDLPPGPGLPVSCLGRPLTLARGPFALSRLTGAPVVPLVARWRRAGLEVRIGEALAPLPSDATRAPADDPETALAAAAARWLESYLRKSPSDLGLGLLQDLLRSRTGEI
jgi:lauroyl/myristoyl acyltransferase